MRRSREGGHVDNAVVVAGYVVMRVAMVAQWLRAARQDPLRRKACLTYALWITIAQIGWLAAIFVHTSVPVTGMIVVSLVLVEMIGPLVAELRQGGTPWHAHHIAERYGLFTIIALGEAVVGTVASVSAVVGERGWSVEAVCVALAGTGLTFGMWWIYFVLPHGDTLAARRERSFWFGYLHMVVFTAIVATGAGLHAAAYYIEHESVLSSAATVAAVAGPVALYIASVYALHSVVVREVQWPAVLTLGLTAAVCVAAVALAAAGVPMAFCLLVVTLAPVCCVLADEVARDRRAAAVADDVGGRD